MDTIQGSCLPQRSAMKSKAQSQNKRDLDIQKTHQDAKSQKDEDLGEKQSAAAQTLQKKYRGYKARRELKGLSLDPASRWAEVCTIKFYDSPLMLITII